VYTGKGKTCLNRCSVYTGSIRLISFIVTLF